MMNNSRPRVVILGAGFGGLWAVKELADKNVDVLIVDKNNYHTFLPLLYQIAAAEIDSSQIIYPIRKITHKHKNIDFLRDEVVSVDFKTNHVYTKKHEILYDFLVIGLGSRPYFFRTPGAEEHAMKLKDVKQAIEIRNRILTTFEYVQHIEDEKLRRELLNFIVVGGGPTGVEFVSALMELIQGPLKKDFPKINFDEVSIKLIESSDRLIRMYSEKQSKYVKNRLEKMGIEIILNTTVTNVDEYGLTIKSGEYLVSRNIIWTAGVQGNPISQLWGLRMNHRGQIMVNKYLETVFENVYAIGDIAAVEDQEIPMVAQGAVQMGKFAAKSILSEVSGKSTKPFKYKDKGSMAVVGRYSAVVKIGRIKLKGIIAWYLWIMLHLIKLVGFRNKLSVLINWSYSYLFFEKSNRFITPLIDEEKYPFEEITPELKKLI
jgi:NADH:ubiquinone reductase (H+-translocating)